MTKPAETTRETGGKCTSGSSRGPDPPRRPRRPGCGPRPGGYSWRRARRPWRPGCGSWHGGNSRGALTRRLAGPRGPRGEGGSRGARSGREVAPWEDRSRRHPRCARRFPHDSAVVAPTRWGAGANDPPRAPEPGSDGARRSTPRAHEDRPRRSTRRPQEHGPASATPLRPSLYEKKERSRGLRGVADGKERSRG